MGSKKKAVPLREAACIIPWALSRVLFEVPRQELRWYLYRVEGLP